MKLDLDEDKEWDIAQKITVDFLKHSLDISLEWGSDEEEIKAYLYVLSDNMYIGDFKQYAKEKNLEHHCESIYKAYQD